MLGFTLTVATEVMDKQALTQPEKGIWQYTYDITYQFFVVLSEHMY